MPRDCNTCQCHGGQWECTTSACPVKDCGGFLGNTCSADEYCAYMPGQACGTADASSTCAPRPETCPDIYMPVCACDGMSYPSACEAARHGQGVMQTGACQVKSCGGELGNTCGANEYCAYKSGQACGTADATSTCEPRPETCPDIYMPVCGCDGVNYPSACDAALHGQGVMAAGSCTVK